METHRSQCEACKTFPLYHGVRIFWDAYLLDGQRYGGWDWMDFLSVWSNDDCGLCKLIRHTFQSHYGYEQMSEWIKLLKSADEPTIPIRIYRMPLNVAFDEYSMRPGQRTAYYLELTYYRPPQISGEPQRLKRQALFAGDAVTEESKPKLHLVVLDSKRGVWPLLGRRVDENTIDWQEVQRWLEACTSRHTSGSARSILKRSNLTTSLLVVDVRLRCIMHLPIGCSYLALSYQCGKDQDVKLVKEAAKLLQIPGSLILRLPSKTILDAMTVTEALGFQYLWVDCLCIVQDSPEDLAQKISQMHEIYNNSALTLVAAAGQSPDFGLPGVSCPRLEVQATAEICSSGTNMIMLTNLLDNQSHAVITNRWNTRAWTYQERLLSRRLLMFTTSQVYFACSDGCEAREDVHMPDDSEAVMNIVDERYKFDVDYTNVFERYAVMLQKYSGRSMSDSADKINAFSGLLNRLAVFFEGPFLFGIPTTLFDVGLLWLPVGGCVRGSTSFPSWSWAGWTGPVWYEEKDSLMNLSICNISIASIQTKDGQLLCDDLSSCSSESEHELYEQAGYTRGFDESTEEIYYKKTESTDGTLYPRPMRRIARLNIPPSYLLQVRGLVAKFRLSTKLRYEEPFHLTYLQVLDTNQKLVGTVYIDESQVESLQEQRRAYRFAALTRATLYRNSEDRSWDVDHKCFRLWHHRSSRQLPHRTKSDDETAIWQNKLLDHNLASQGRFDSMEELAADFDEHNSERTVFPIKDKLPFDPEVYNKNIYWPIINVLLLSEANSGGHVERLGIGKIHVDAFLPYAKVENISLG